MSEAFLAQIDSLGDLVETEIWPIESRARLVLSTPEIYGITQIILAGSGDSHAAALAAAPAIRAWTGLPVQPMVAMEASRYVDLGPARKRGLLVVAISSSGEAARLVEAVHRLNENGALTLALTANRGSRVGSAASKCLDIAIPPAPSAPGTRSYVASLLGLYLLGIRLAEVRMAMTMDTANALRKTLAALADPLTGLADQCRPSLQSFAERHKGAQAADILGSGPSFGTAAYGAAKLIEAAGIHAAAIDAEEFHHLNYFVAAPETLPTVLFAPSAAASSGRTRELVETLAELGRPHLVVTDDPGFAPPEVRIVLPPAPEFFQPVLQTVPAALLAAFWTKANGATPYRGHTGPWRGAAGAHLVRNSKLDLPEPRS